jgi:hypothetical protein
MNWQGLQAFNDLLDETQGIGHVYFIRCQNAIKIGHSHNVLKRFMELQSAKTDTLRPAFFPNPKYTLLHIIRGDQILERILHSKMFNRGIIGEWFLYDEIADNLIDFMIDIETDRKIWDNGWEIQKKRPEWWQTLQKKQPMTFNAYVSAALDHFDAGSLLVFPGKDGIIYDGIR